MKKAFIILSLLIFSGIIYQQVRFSYASPQDFPSTQIDTTLIGVLGDSWVAHGQLDSLLEVYTGKQVVSFGYPGATSKRIYQNLGEVIKLHPKYCIVIAGVNDRAQLMGAEYYGYHVNLIREALIRNGITPIIVETAEFDLNGLYKNMNFLSKARNKITAFFNGSLNDSLQDYRNKVYAQVKFPGISKEFYRNAAHLNEKGNEVMCWEIANYFNGYMVEYDSSTKGMLIRYYPVSNGDEIEIKYITIINP